MIRLPILMPMAGTKLYKTAKLDVYGRDVRLIILIAYGSWHNLIRLPLLMRKAGA